MIQMAMLTLINTNSTGGSDQDHPQEKERQKGKMIVCRGLTNI